VVQNKVEAAYARSDLFERRRLLMDDWAAYVGRQRELGMSRPVTRVEFVQRSTDVAAPAGARGGGMLGQAFEKRRIRFSERAKHDSHRVLLF